LPASSAVASPMYGFLPVARNCSTAGVTVSPGRGLISSGELSSAWRNSTAGSVAALGSAQANWINKTLTIILLDCFTSASKPRGRPGPAPSHRSKGFLSVIEQLLRPRHPGEPRQPARCAREHPGDLQSDLGLRDRSSSNSPRGLCHPRQPF